MMSLAHRPLTCSFIFRSPFCCFTFASLSLCLLSVVGRRKKMAKRATAPSATTTTTNSPPVKLKARAEIRFKIKVGSMRIKLLVQSFAGTSRAKGLIRDDKNQLLLLLASFNRASRFSCRQLIDAGFVLSTTNIK